MVHFVNYHVKLYSVFDKSKCYDYNYLFCPFILLEHLAEKY